MVRGRNRKEKGKLKSLQLGPFSVEIRRPAVFNSHFTRPFIHPSKLYGTPVVRDRPLVSDHRIHSRLFKWKGIQERQLTEYVVKPEGKVQCYTAMDNSSQVLKKIRTRNSGCSRRILPASAAPHSHLGWDDTVDQT